MNHVEFATCNSIWLAVVAGHMMIVEVPVQMMTFAVGNKKIVEVESRIVVVAVAEAAFSHRSRWLPALDIVAAQFAHPRIVVVAAADPRIAARVAAARTAGYSPKRMTLRSPLERCSSLQH